MSVSGITSFSAVPQPDDTPPRSAAAATSQDARALYSEQLGGQTALKGVLDGSTSLGVGARGEAAKLVQEALIGLGFDLGRWGADGSFGRATERAVSAFQRQSGLTASGKVDRDTLLALDKKLGPRGLRSALLSGNAQLGQVAAGRGSVARGARGEAAKLVQEALLSAGYDLGRWGADGSFGRATEGVVRQFQRDSGLPQTGEVDRQTLLALDAELPKAAAVPNDLVFLGMGDGAKFEAEDLAKRTDVLGISDSAAGDDMVTVRVDGREQTLDLTTDDGLQKFVGSLGLEGAKAETVADIIREAGHDAKDETAMLLKAFCEAENGERTIERMVLSGHSVGTGVWGDSNGFFALEQLESICEAFPNAAAQVEDFMIAGCYSSSETTVERFREMLPNVKTVWAYGDSAPGTWSGAMVHNRLWEGATRGHDASRLDRSVAAGTRKGDHVATWNIDDGYMADGELRKLSEIKGDLAELEHYYEPFFSGEAEVQDTQYGPLRDYYRLVQEQLGHPELPADEHKTLEVTRDRTIRLIYFDQTVKHRFQEAYAEQVASGFESLGLEVPDFSQLSRAGALEAIAGFESALSGAAHPPQAASELLPLLTEGLRDLSTDYIPNTWV